MGVSCWGRVDVRIQCQVPIFKNHRKDSEIFVVQRLQATAIIADGLLGEEVVTQEFYVSVTPVRDGEYLVRTERVAMGVPLAEELVSWSVDRWLAQAVHVMHDPLVGLLRGHRGGSATSTADTEACDLVSLGQELYNALFRGTIRDSWMIAQGVAQNQHEILRLRLGLKDDKLPLLPWEVLHDGARPLATGTDVVFSRYRSAFSKLPSPGVWQRAAAAEHPLRILMVLAAPTDQEVLQLHQEASHLQMELQREAVAGSSSNLELSILDQPGREQLTQALERGRYDILHYAGHSDLSASGGDLYLVSNKTGLTEVLSGDDLAGLLVNNGVRMVVFNSCQGAFTATASDAGSNSGNLADALLKRGVPAVLAMAERIPDDVALNLSRLFYRNLKQRSPIDLGLSRARQGLLSSYGSDQLYWALPILYLHPEFDGYLQASEKPGRTVDDREPFDDAGFDDFYQPGFADAEDLLNDLEHGDPEDRAAVLELIQEMKQPATSHGVNSGMNGNGRSATAAPAADRAETQPLQDAADFNRLGRRLHQQGDWSGAIGAYGDALKLAPDSAEVYSNLGEALERYGSLPEALTAYKMALQFDPNWVDARQNLDRLVHGGSLATTTPTAVMVNRDPRSAASNAGATPPLPQQSLYSQSTLNGRTKPSHESSPMPLKTLAMLGTTVAVLGSIWFLAARPNANPGATPSRPLGSNGGSPTANPTGSPTGNHQADNQNLVTIATQSFSQNDLRRGQEAVEQLLDRGALVEAEGALNTVTASQVENPSVSYLRGRVAWEAVRRNKNSTYSVEDARRYWLMAAKAQPTNAVYQNALGFAFYAEGDWKRAQEAWEKAATLVATQPGSGNAEKLVAEAGQALVLIKESEKSPDRKAKAIELRDRVMQANPTAFTDRQLAADWRWSEAAIGDWKKLMAVK
jgi:tetratricopeptide (TPR) repeat protein